MNCIFCSMKNVAVKSDYIFYTFIGSFHCIVVDNERCLDFSLFLREVAVYLCNSFEKQTAHGRALRLCFFHLLFCKTELFKLIKQKVKKILLKYSKHKESNIQCKAASTAAVIRRCTRK